MKTISLFYYYEKVFMDAWEKFNETLLPEKEDCYSQLNMEDITMPIMHTQKEFVKILK